MINSTQKHRLKLIAKMIFVNEKYILVLAIKVMGDFCYSQEDKDGDFTA